MASSSSQSSSEGQCWCWKGGKSCKGCSAVYSSSRFSRGLSVQFSCLVSQWLRIIPLGKESLICERDHIRVAKALSVWQGVEYHQNNPAKGGFRSYRQKDFGAFRSKGFHRIKGKTSFTYT